MNGGKLMGRMDGDMIDSATEAGTIEGWRRECERLREENKHWQDHYDRRHKDQLATAEDNKKLKAQCERLRQEIEEVKASGGEWEKAARLAWAQLREQQQSEPIQVAPLTELKSIGALLAALPVSLEIEYGPLYSGREAKPVKFTLKSSK